MSLVGPRPQREAEVALYDDAAHRRLLMKPGISGLWQVSGRSDLDWDDAIRLDLYYVENWSITGDIVILWRTIRAVDFAGKGRQLMAGVIVHEWIEKAGGAEKVLDAMINCFPNADLRVLWNDAHDRYDGRTIAESWISRTPLRKRKALALPSDADDLEKSPGRKVL